MSRNSASISRACCAGLKGVLSCLLSSKRDLSEDSKTESVAKRRAIDT